MQLSVDHDTLVVTLTFWEKIWCIHGSLRIPLAHVRAVKAELPPSSWKEFRMPGSFVPGLIKAGTYLTPRGKEFWCVMRGHPRHLCIELEGERYARLVLALPADADVPKALMA
jgi:hypothetical protein